MVYGSYGADHSHYGYAQEHHSHGDDGRYAYQGHDHDTEHDHDREYAPLDHGHPDLVDLAGRVAALERAFHTLHEMIGLPSRTPAAADEADAAETCPGGC